MIDSLYVLKVLDEEEIYTYEYGNLPHAQEHFDFEKYCIMFEYNNGKYKAVKAK